MNKFLKNNKIITCILCFVLLNSPASASTDPIATSFDPASVPTVPIDVWLPEQISARDPRRQYTNRLVLIMRKQCELHRVAPEQLKRDVSETGIYIIPGGRYYFQDAGRTAVYIAQKTRYTINLISKSGLKQAPWNVAQEVLARTPAWFQLIVSWDPLKRRLRFFSDLMRFQPPYADRPLATVKGLVRPEPEVPRFAFPQQPPSGEIPEAFWGQDLRTETEQGPRVGVPQLATPDELPDEFWGIDMRPGTSKVPGFGDEDRIQPDQFSGGLNQSIAMPNGHLGPATDDEVK
ncbi:MAG: hypothetical protein NkDv07_0761 [Candidatus Improbicoccus devescovinae]|nr:MAG: hypothetical protein NkDv07_0761 [Candidatus Improbicoccus devescovinae]